MSILNGKKTIFFFSSFVVKWRPETLLLFRHSQHNVGDLLFSNRCPNKVLLLIFNSFLSIKDICICQWKIMSVGTICSLMRCWDLSANYLNCCISRWFLLFSTWLGDFSIYSQVNNGSTQDLLQYSQFLKILKLSF